MAATIEPRRLTEATLTPEERSGLIEELLGNETLFSVEGLSRQGYSSRLDVSGLDHEKAAKAHSEAWHRTVDAIVGWSQAGDFRAHNGDRVNSMHDQVDRPVAKMILEKLYLHDATFAVAARLRQKRHDRERHEAREQARVSNQIGGLLEAHRRKQRAELAKEYRQSLVKTIQGDESQIGEVARLAELLGIDDEAVAARIRQIEDDPNFARQILED